MIVSKSSVKICAVADGAKPASAADAINVESKGLSFILVEMWSFFGLKFLNKGELIS